jgi:hypothetical protein
MFLIITLCEVNSSKCGSEVRSPRACNYYYLGWVLTWKYMYLKQGFWGEILLFGWKITHFENCVLHEDCKAAFYFATFLTIDWRINLKKSMIKRKKRTIDWQLFKKTLHRNLQIEQHAQTKYYASARDTLCIYALDGSFINFMGCMLLNL